MQAQFQIIDNEKFLNKLNKIANKAKKYGYSVPKIVDSQELTNQEVYINDRKFVVNYTVYTIDYDVFSAGNCTLIAKFNHIENIIRTVPNQILPEQYLHPTNQCDHCHINRQRNDTYLIQLSDGEYKQIGGNCLSDYFDIDANSILSWCDLSFTLADELTEEIEPKEFTNNGRYMFDLIETLKVTYYIIEKYGYLSTKNSIEQEKMSTKMRVLDYFLDEDSNWAILNDYTTKAQTVKEYMLTLGNEKNEYLLNLYNLATNNNCSFNSLGYAVSAIIAYNRHIEKNSQKENTQQTSKGYYGKVGEKFTAQNLLTVTVKAVSKEIYTQYGVKCFYTLENKEGYVFKWYTDCSKLKINNTYTLTGTIKGYSEFNGEKSTELTNCRIK